jgi:adenylate cyclase class IV
MGKLPCYNFGTMAHYEVEIKSLLGDKENRDALIARMQECDPQTSLVSKNKQLNHYFEGGDVAALVASVQNLFATVAQERLALMVAKGKNFSVRTREKDGEVLLVLKASVDEGTSSNTVSRLEFEEPVALSLEELDQQVLAAGFEYQAKWSREREEYAYKGANVCLDRNAGYGYLAEFERITEEEASVASVRAEIEALMAELGVAELSQARLERMFAHYNAHWPEYYGTDKVFVIE